MKIEHILLIVEIIAVSYCGLKVAAGKNPMRWNNTPRRLLFYGFLLLDIALQLGNTFFCKFSAVMLIVHSIYIFVLIYVFYYVKFWELFCHNFIFWLTYMLIKYLFLCIGCFLDNVPLYRYIENKYDEPWQPIHLVSMTLMIIAVVGLSIYISKKDGPLIHCRSESGYRKIAFLVIAEEIVNEVLFNKKIAFMNIDTSVLFLIVFVLWSLFLFSIIIAVLTVISDFKEQKHISDLNYTLLKNQYEQLQDIYDLNLRKLHDQAQFCHIGKEMLKENGINKNIDDPDQKKELLFSGQKLVYTGISVIDFILNYKIREASRYNIQIDAYFDIYICPLEPSDMCILLGSLLDNAIDAVKELEEDKRKIHLKMKNPNNIFILEISNPYMGKRIKKDGRYITTKPDKNVHGFGLDSVERIAGKLEGVIDISDENNTFTIMVALFGRIETKNQNTETN